MFVVLSLCLFALAHSHPIAQQKSSPGSVDSLLRSLGLEGDFTDQYCRATQSCDLVAFGASITDDGIDLAKGDIYGFHRLSNGPIWVDYLATELGFPQSNVKNHAFAGAMSGLNNYNFIDQSWSGQLWQVERYLSGLTFPAIDPSTLIVLEAGGFNDLYWATEQKNDETVAQTEVSAVDNTLKSLEKLITKGAKRILVMELIDDTYAPYLAYEAAEEQRAQIHQSTKNINENLARKLQGLKADYPDLRLVLMRYPAGFFEQEVAPLIPNTFQSTTHKKPGTFFKENLEYGWYDQYHPNTQLHQIIGRKVYEAWMENVVGEELSKLVL